MEKDKLSNLEGNGFRCEIIADSMAPCGKRLTTITARFGRYLLAEWNTHRAFARNAASSRAIPWPKMMKNIETDPFFPAKWGAEQKGMQTGDEIENIEEANKIWLEARDDAVRHAQRLADLGVHKSICNRLTESWMWVVNITSATEWNNFFRLRCHQDAEPSFQKIAYIVRDTIQNSVPKQLKEGEWHLPYIQEDELYLPIEDLKKISAARIARVSFLTHDGKRDTNKDIELFTKLVNGSGFGHFSPHEHVAQALSTLERSGPFIGWKQFRKEFQFENAEG